MAIAEARDPVELIKSAFPDAFQEVVLFSDETTIVVDPAQIVPIMRYLRDTPGLIYNYLSDISPVDYYPDYSRPERFGISYHVYSMLYNRRLRVKAYLPEEEPVIESVTSVWPAANWLEREAYDMMGIEFKNHPNLRRILNPIDWDGYPHRRDYPLSYETIQFSFNAEEIMKRKPFARE